MITIFNRKEVFVTFSMEIQAKTREALTANNIDYTVKVVNRNSPSALSDTRAGTGTLGQNLDIAYEYIFYVRSKDYDKAVFLLGSSKLR